MVLVVIRADQQVDETYTHGLEVLAQWKANPVSQSIPVVILTSSAEDKDIENAYKLGANSYIVKPVDFEKFLDVAEQIEIYWCATNQPPF